MNAAAATFLAVWTAVLSDAAPAQAKDTAAWAPLDDAAVVRGRETAPRLALADTVEVSVEVSAALSPANRTAIAAAEEALRKAPGVRRVRGPAPVLPAGGPGEGAGPDSGATTGLDGDAWLLPAGGRAVRFLVEGTNLASARKPITEAIRASGLPLAHADAVRSAGAPLWHRPRGRPLGWPGILVIGVWAFAAAAIGTRLMGSGRLLGWRGSLLVAAAGGVGAAGLFAAVEVDSVRTAAFQAAVVAAGLAAAGGVAVAAGRRSAALAVTRRAPMIAGVATLAMAAAVALQSRIAFRSDEGSKTSFLYVDVRADMSDPLVLRELRRLTDYLRTLPGVAQATSVADGGPGADMLKTADGREGLVLIRLDHDVVAHGRETLRRLDTYLEAELRGALLSVRVADPNLPAVTRTIAKGILAADARERIERLCARHGRRLTEEEVLGIDRVAKQAAFVPTADPAKLKAETEVEARALIAGFTSAGKGAGAASTPAGEAKFLTAVVKLNGDSTVDDARRALAAHSPSLADGDLQSAARDLHARLAEIRRRHAAEINVSEMLFAANVPVDGPLAPAVRQATLEAMADVTGVPVDPATPGAVRIDAMAVGGAAHDRALAGALGDGARRGAVLALGAVALILFMAGGVRGLMWVPLAVLPLVVIVLGAALTGRAASMADLVTAAAALTFGATLAAAAAARWRAVTQPAAGSGA